MNRRWFVVGAALAALGAPSVAPAASSEDPVALVRSVYTRAATPGARALPERDFLVLLSADLRKAWQQRIRTAGAGGAERLRAAVFGPGTGAGRSLSVKRVTDIPGLPKERIVAVEFTVEADTRQDTRQVFVHLAPDAGSWTIVNIIYDEGDDFRHVAEQPAQKAG